MKRYTTNRPSLIILEYLEVFVTPIIKEQKEISLHNEETFMGYPYEKKGWRLFDLEKEEFCVSRDVVFCEDEFPHANLETSKETNTTTPLLWEPISGNGVYKEDELQNESRRIASDQNKTATTIQSHVDRPTNGPITQQAQDLPSSSTSSTLPTTTNTEESSDTTLIEPALGHGQRKRVPPVTLKNFITNSAQTRLLNNPAKATKELLYPISNYISFDRFSARHIAYQVSIGKITPPKTYKKAVMDERF